MTPLAKILARRITANGPISLAEYMAECLSHPDFGYYTTRDPIGRAGDFTTAPEISQMFGECLGLALAQAWMDQGRPNNVVLTELGPGRGTLMADVLRSLRIVPEFIDAIDLHLVEHSPTLRERQRTAIRDRNVTWHKDLLTLPQGPLFLLANEFFDALPIRQFVRTGTGWCERQVGLLEGHLALGLSTPASIAALTDRLDDTKDGDVVETCPALPSIISEIGKRISGHGGLALITDYGGWHSLGDTFQAVRNHKPEDPLAHPGEADLTAHVDFEAIAQAADPALATEMVEQGTLLERLGIRQRTATLAKKLTGERLDQHLLAYQRLTDPSEMGSVFKALALYPQNATPPPGFQ